MVGQSRPIDGGSAVSAFHPFATKSARTTNAALGQPDPCSLQHDPCKKRDRRKAVSQKPDRMFGSGGCALGFFDLEVASDSIEHGHLSLLDRCDGIVDGERSVFVQQLGRLEARLTLKSCFRWATFDWRLSMSAAIFAFIPFHWRTPYR